MKNNPPDFSKIVAAFERRKLEVKAAIPTLGTTSPNMGTIPKYDPTIDHYPEEIHQTYAVSDGG